MIGILIISHGMMADGMRDSLSMFFGEIPQMDTMSLKMESDATQFGIEMGEKIKKLDTGDGVVIFADLLGGTPCNQALRHVGENVHLVTGMNLPMIMEVLGAREIENISPDTIVRIGQQTIIDAGAKLMSSQEDVDDD